MDLGWVGSCALLCDRWSLLGGLGLRRVRGEPRFRRGLSRDERRRPFLLSLAKRPGAELPACPGCGPDGLRFILGLGVQRVMSMMITILTLVPIVGGLVVIGQSPDSKRLVRWMSLGFSLVVLVVVAAMWSQFNPAADGLQFEMR